MAVATKEAMKRRVAGEIVSGVCARNEPRLLAFLDAAMSG